jgi:hypothetical protein
MTSRAPIKTYGVDERPSWHVRARAVDTDEYVSLGSRAILEPINPGV